MSQFIEMFGCNTPTQKISKVCYVRGGSTPTRTNKEFWDNGTVPWFTIEDIYEQGRYIYDTKQLITELATNKCFVYPIDTVLICCTASIGEYAMTKKEMASNQQFNGMMIKDKKQLHPDFLLYVASTLKDNLLCNAGKTTINFVSRSKLESLEIPVPLYEEQVHFVSIFKQADKSKFGDFKSQFIEMFGNTSKGMLGKFTQVIRGVSYKPSDVKTADDPDTAVILRSNNINDANLNTDEVVYIDKNRVSGDQYLRVNDIVVCASNGSKALVGKAAINKTLTNQYAHGAFCLLVRPNDNINPVYLNTFFQTSLYKKQIDELAAGSNILNIKQEHLTNMILPLPIIEEQNKFAIIAEQADKSKSYVRIAFKNLESMLGYCIRQIS